jgi:hypoxanthine phosphoribosyltransferase
MGNRHPPVNPDYSALPQQVVTAQRVSFTDVGSGFDALRGVVVELDPDLILGVNRGGAAVGGMLAKSVGLLAYVLEVDFTPASANDVIEHRIGPPPTVVHTVVLVDDIVRTGSHMRLAARHVHDRYPDAVVHRFALVEVDVSPPERAIDWAPLKATRQDARTPWEA